MATHTSTSDQQEQIVLKLMEIYKLKKDIVRLMLPTKTYGHLEVIGREVKAMVIEAVTEAVTGWEPMGGPAGKTGGTAGDSHGGTNKGDSHQGVKKVTID